MSRDLCNTTIVSFTLPGRRLMYVEQDITGPRRPLVDLIDPSGTGNKTYQSNFNLAFYSTTSDTQVSVDSTTYSRNPGMAGATTVDSGTGYYTATDYWLGTGSGLKCLRYRNRFGFWDGKYGPGGHGFYNH